MDLNGKSYLKCAVCAKLFENPKLLPCGHNFCERCLQYHIVQTVRVIGYDIFNFLDNNMPDYRPSETKFKCPVDEKEITPPNPAQEVRKWAGQFENNLKIVTLLEICEGKLRGVIEYCDNCIEMSQKVEATCVCLTCAEKYCVKCAFIHRHNHSKDSLYSLSSVQFLFAENVSSANHSAETIAQCKIHVFCPLDLFCHDCKERCCRTCHHTVHNECRHVSNLVNDMEGYLEANISHEKLIDRCKRALSQISIVMKNNLELFERANNLLNKGSEINGKRFDYIRCELNCEIERWEFLYEQLQQTLKHLNGVINASTNYITQINIQTEIECQQIEKEIECHFKLKTKNCERFQKFEDALSKWEHETKDTKTINMETTEAQFDKFIESAKMNTGTTNTLIDVTSKVRRVEKINMHLDNDEEGCWLTDCMSLAVDCVIVSDRANKCIKWKNSNGPVKRLGLKSAPQCLAADRNRSHGCVTLPDEKSVQFFCIENECIKLDHQLCTKEKCYGVDFIDMSQIIVSCKGNEESFVCILNENGSEIRRFSRNEGLTRATLFSDPRYVKARTNGDELKIYVTDFNLETVTCITLPSLEGLFTTESIFHDKMDKPLGLANDNDGNLVVCCNSKGNVQQVVDENAHVKQHRVLAQSLWLPRAISFLQGGNLFMITSDSGPCQNHVLVYEYISKSC